MLGGVVMIIIMTDGDIVMMMTALHLKSGLVGHLKRISK